MSWGCKARCAHRDGRAGRAFATDVATVEIAAALVAAVLVAASPACAQQQVGQTDAEAADDVNTALPAAANIGQQSIGELFPEPIKTWNGLRPYLADRGLQFAVTYQGDPMGVVSGGLRQGASYIGRLQTTIEYDPQKTLGWAGGLFHVSGYQIHGVALTPHFVGSLAPVSDLEAVATTRLFELWYEQRLGTKVTVRFGQLAADTEFFLSPFYGIGIGGTFGWPTITAARG